MAGIDAKLVMKLREETGAPMMEAKKALVEAGGDLEKARRLLRMRGQAAAAGKAGRHAAEGRVYSYIHHNHKVGVMVEVDCETDFVARSEAFEAYLKDLCLHVAFKKETRYVSREDVPPEVLDQERQFLLDQVQETLKGKPEEVRRKVVEGRLAKFYSEYCLMEQPFVKDDSRTIEEMRRELVSKVGENVVVKRFARFEVGVD